MMTLYPGLNKSVGNQLRSVSGFPAWFSAET
ncbi:hypothetical protein HD_0965 [[Haemophilus] ducreyi 35000HP]|uniref:Uncharacterized protein n=1 Tax=Haemophilus ducreyi (strain 35000HP / ATCC 700724) TaxID=233412 RepID=Q7VML0_HAEDU|nr:hypothetical protein HD_0965 [[Haemophilus] ducreyi 35000HP]